MKHFVRVQCCLIRNTASVVTLLLDEMIKEVGPKYELIDHSVATMIHPDTSVYVTVSAIFDERVK